MNDLTFEIEIDGGESSKYAANPRDVYEIVAKGIKNILSGEMRDNMSETEKNLIRLTRVTVKGALLAFGNQLLDVMFKTKDHPKPAKGDDLIAWYSDMFAQIMIGEATKGTLVLKGKSNGKAIFIDQICPISLAGSIGGTDASEGEGNADDQEASESECL